MDEEAGRMPAAEMADPTLLKVSFRQTLKESEHQRGFFSVIATLTIGIIGGAVLPVSWAFSQTGILAGVIIMVVVALANAYTSDLLLRQTYKVGATDYESLAFKIGGWRWKLVTEVSIFLLMFGSMVGGLQQVGEIGAIGLLSISKQTPRWLVNGSGRAVMAMGTVFLIAPLCFLPHIRQMEYAGVVGTCIVLWLATTTVIDASRTNFPAIRDHTLSKMGFTRLGSITQAVSIFGLAFYIQPIFMPLILEMTPGKVGAKIISWGNRVVVLVNAFLIYFAVGFFGAARYGSTTASNILENVWLGGGLAQGALNLSMMVYLAVSCPLGFFPLRHTVLGWLPGDKERHKVGKSIFVTVLLLVTCLGFAEAFPNSSAKVLTATGATGVCMVSYFIPIVNHMLLFYGRANCQREAKSTTLEEGPGELLPTTKDHWQAQPDVYNIQYSLSYRNANTPGMLEMTKNVLMPAAVLAVGLFCSAAALSTIR